MLKSDPEFDSYLNQIIAHADQNEAKLIDFFFKNVISKDDCKIENFLDGILADITKIGPNNSYEVLKLKLAHYGLTKIIQLILERATNHEPIE